MEEQKTTDIPVAIEDQKPPTDPEWMTFRTTKDGFRSKAKIKTSFFNEHKNNLKTIHYNKRRFRRGTDSLENIPNSQPANSKFPINDKSTDKVYQTAVPNSVSYTYQGLGSRIYNTKFTSDGRKIVVATQSGTSVFDFHDDGKIELTKSARCSNLHWAITDVDISADNRFLVHSNLSPFVHMFNIEKGSYSQEFCLKAGGTNIEMADELFWFFSLRIYSLKLSNDNKEIIAACGKALGGAPIQVFDVETNKLKKSILTHKEDVNSVCYLDRNNSNIFLTGSDDGVCKVWDARILKNFEPVGIFYGHVSGVTHVESKGDNRYFISNCKDQSLKLWDIRNTTTEKKNYPFLKYDYRNEFLSSQHIEQIKNYQKRFDKAVMTYWGHQIHSTLIRCHFSPLHGTNQRFIYTGSYDGKIYLYDINTGENVACLEATNEEDFDPQTRIVRDCTWHPYSQNIISGNFQQDLHRWEYLNLRETDANQPDFDLNDDDTTMWVEAADPDTKKV